MSGTRKQSNRRVLQRRNAEYPGSAQPQSVPAAPNPTAERGYDKSNPRTAVVSFMHGTSGHHAGRPVWLCKGTLRLGAAVGRCRRTLRLGNAGILCVSALQAHSAVGCCRDTLRSGTPGKLGGWILCGWAMMAFGCFGLCALLFELHFTRQTCE